MYLGDAMFLPKTHVQELQNKYLMMNMIGIQTYSMVSHHQMSNPTVDCSCIHGK